jgi:phage shock protein A
MGFFARLAALLRSNLNELISRSEDPEKMLNQVILDMNQQLLEAKKQVALAIADEKQLAKQVEQGRAAVESWEKKAMLAVRSSDDVLAKEALLRKREHESLTKQLAEQWKKQQAAAEHLKTALRAHNHKIDEAKRKKAVLIARKRRADAMKKIQETMSGLSDTSAFETFDRMAQKIDQMEAEAEASAELAEEATGDVLTHKFAELEATKGADEELLALKRRMGLAPETAPAVTATAQAAAEEEAEMADLEAALDELKRRVQ